MASATVGINFIIKEGPDGLKRLVTDADSLRRVMKETLRVTETFHTKAINFASMATGVKAATDAIGQLGSTLTALTQDYATYDGAMKAANTMAGKGSEDFARLKDSVTDLSKEIPMARDLLAKGLYQTISNGVPEDNWIDFLRTSARSAVGGIADLERVVGVTSTVIKNYGLSWEEAAGIQDKIQLTAKNGVTSFEQLSAALPRVTGNAATLGVSIDELMASFATLTGVSGNTAEVSTQLAAIFSALVKPSSEATKMAAEMGIQFDAAAIKAAGGFEAFLHSLDKSVKAYSAASGVLEQEVYGKLFGSAESLRALVPLQGELATKFSENVANMADSAGTMDAAFADMASTGEATAQRLKNRFAGVTDTMARLLAKVTPLTNFSAALLTSASSVVVLSQSFTKLNLVQNTVLLKQKALTLAQTLYKGAAVSLTAINRTLAGSFNGVTVGATTAAVAIRGLLISTGVGAAIAGLTAVLVHYSRKTEDAKVGTEALKEAQEEYVRAGADAKMAVDSDIKALGELIKTGKDCTEMVKTLNERYGDLFGTHQKEAEWMDLLTKKSQVYVKAKAYEAEAIRLRQKAAEQAMARERAAEKMARMEKEGTDKETYNAPVVTGRTVRSRMVTVETEEYSRLRAERDEAVKLEKQVQEELDVVDKMMGKAVAELNSGVTVPSTPSTPTTPGDSKTPKTPKNPKTRHIVADPRTKEELQTNVELTRTKLTGADTEQEHSMLRNIKLWEDQLEAIKMTEAAYTRPRTLDTLERIDEELQYQRTLRQKSGTEYIAGIDAEIERLESLKTSMEDAAFVPEDIDGIKTYEQLEKQLSHYRALVRCTSGEERDAAQKSVNALEDVRAEWDLLLADLRKPADISLIGTQEELDKAISYYRGRMDRASADERMEIQRTINALEKKAGVLNRGVDLANLEKDVAEIESLTGKEYTVKVKAMDIGALTSQIRELQRMLADTDDPVTDAQRESIEKLIGTYSRWRKEATDTGGAVASAWGEVKNLESGVRSITSALGDNASAWDRLTGIVDGFLGVFEGLRKMVELVNLFTRSTEALTIAKEAESLATDADTVATAANTGATAANTAEAAANTAAKSGEAVAGATASGAAMPFPLNLAAIAAGIAAVTGALSMAGKFAGGGIVGGNSPSGDRLLARVNSGEMILNMTQQRRLFNLLDGNGTIRSVNMPEPITVNPMPLDISDRYRTGSGSPGGGTVRFHIRGRDLVGVMANETRITSKSGKRTDIKI